MRVGNSNKNNNNISKIYAQMQMLQPLFTKIMVVNPVSKEIYNLDNCSITNAHEICTEQCPLRNDKCGCICKDTISTGEDRCRFIYNKKEAYFVISSITELRGIKYTLVMIMRLNPSFSFGTVDETKAIKEITEVSSNLVIDPLTKIFNRKYLTDNIEFMMKEARRNNQPLNLACIDIDNFKRFNDTYGHEFGDKVLIEVAKNMSESIKVIENAYPVRIGGDEFVIIAIGISKQRFKAIMNKLCTMVDSNKLLYNHKRVGICISIGVSEMLSDRVDSYKELYSIADSQLYKAKEAGKGCVR